MRAMALAAGSRLGPYEILAPIGAGGMGEVYSAVDTRLKRSVAIQNWTVETAGRAARRRLGPGPYAPCHLTGAAV
jgi:hypothetical protein